MPQMLSSLRFPAQIVLPLVARLTVFTLLLIIRRLLRRKLAIRGIGVVYLLGAPARQGEAGATLFIIRSGTGHRLPRSAI